ncbi:hypothetical protein ROA7745_01628 [Roseovarius aestuarii]|uniref:Uncharacterized protein n=1 Tax=Roseovarius aestuarii TaxID=475083 RepID=A0A1X7BRJ4_9RHOB|nr:hypothetical protein ROA7745_01628 [Roseovarius aestuarii]
MYSKIAGSAALRVGHELRQISKGSDIESSQKTKAGKLVDVLACVTRSRM